LAYLLISPVVVTGSLLCVFALFSSVFFGSSPVTFSRQIATFYFRVTVHRARFSDTSFPANAVSRGECILARLHRCAG